jgi:DNA-directed RNA polymerase subunit RPC12/RpoP
MCWNYDQWKTASPYDDDIDWGEDYGVECPECGGNVFDGEQSENKNEVVLICVDCGCEFTYNIEEEIDE